MRVLIAIPCMGRKVGLDLLHFVVRCGGSSRHSYQLRTCTDLSPVAYARNRLVAMFIASDADKLWFLDSDVIPPANAEELLDIEGDIVSGICFRSDGKRVLPTVYGPVGSPLLRPYLQDPSDAVCEVEATGAGCMLLSRSCVIELMEGGPLFSSHTGMDGQWVMGEDVAFCQRARREGFTVVVHTGIAFGHLATVDLRAVWSLAAANSQVPAS